MLSFEDSDVPALKESLHRLSQVLGKYPVAEIPRRVNHGDAQLVDAERGGHLRPNKPATYDHGRLALCGPLSHALIVIEDPVVADSVQVSARDREDLRHGAGRQEQFFEAVGFPVTVVDLLVLRVQRRDAPAREESDPILIIKGLVVKEDILDLRLSHPELL